MPQFDTTFFSSQIFWTIISFIILFVVLNRWILPRVAEIIQKRTRLIEEEIEETHRKREEVECLKHDYATKLSEIDQEVKKMFDESEKRIIEKRNQVMGEWKDEMERKKRDFLEDAEVTRRKAIKDIRSQSADLVVAAAEQVIHERIDKAEAQKALDESIDQLEKKHFDKN
ncbi:MAG: F0F1 ATP synthase subunit B [Mariprofundaceae bacterium]